MVSRWVCLTSELPIALPAAKSGSPLPAAASRESLTTACVCLTSDCGCEGLNLCVYMYFSVCTAGRLARCTPPCWLLLNKHRLCVFGVDCTVLRKLKKLLMGMDKSACTESVYEDLCPIYRNNKLPGILWRYFWSESFCWATVLRGLMTGYPRPHLLHNHILWFSSLLLHPFPSLAY